MLRNVGRFYIPAVLGHFKAISGPFPVKWTNGPSGRRKALKIENSGKLTIGPEQADLTGKDENYKNFGKTFGN